MDRYSPAGDWFPEKVHQSIFDVLSQDFFFEKDESRNQKNRGGKP